MVVVLGKEKDRRSPSEFIFPFSFSFFSVQIAILCVLEGTTVQIKSIQSGYAGRVGGVKVCCGMYCHGGSEVEVAEEMEGRKAEGGWKRCFTKGTCHPSWLLFCCPSCLG